MKAYWGNGGVAPLILLSVIYFFDKWIPCPMSVIVQLWSFV